MHTRITIAAVLCLAAFPDPAAVAQERDATDDVRQMIEREQYYKLSGPAGPRYFVVGKDVTLDRATRDGDALAITLKYKKGQRGIQLLNLAGLAELEFTPDGEGAQVRKLRITSEDQTFNFDRPGTLVVKIPDVKSLEKPID
jgi:hypothetical protein